MDDWSLYKLNVAKLIVDIHTYATQKSQRNKKQSMDLFPFHCYGLKPRAETLP